MTKTMAAKDKQTKPNKLADMKSPLVASLIFHVFLILLFSGAFFFFSKPVNFPIEATAIEILPVDDKASSTFDAPIAPKTPEQPKQAEKTPPPTPKSTKQKTTPTPEKPKAAPKQKAEKPAEKPKEQKAPKPLKKDDTALKKLPSKPSTPPAKKPPSPKKSDEAEKPKDDETSNFSSVLKNLVGDDDAAQVPSDARDTNRQAPQLTAPAPLGSQISMSEMDMLRAQLAQCWNVLPGAREAQNLAVDIEVSVTPDKRVATARVIDQLRYSSDSFFRAAADSALRALRSPTCTPLQLPDGKYEQWKSMTVRFDPKDMF